MLKTLLPDPQEPNMLHDVHGRLMNLPMDFRKRVCQECDWSIPTFYRKMRDRPVNKGKEKESALSNAEKDMILAVFNEVFEAIEVYMKKYRKKP